MNHQEKLVAKDATALARLLRRIREKRRDRKKAGRSSRPSRRALSRKDRQAILAKTGGRCHICGGLVKDRWDADHVLAHAGGGEHTVDNYLPAHGLCNNYRWDYTAGEFQLIMKLGIFLRRQIEQKPPTEWLWPAGFCRTKRGD